MKTWLEFVGEDDTLVSFLQNRKNGAAKIAAQAKRKGGPSMLTYWHFAAKAKPYAEVIRAVKEGRDAKWFRARVNEHLRAVHPGMKQRDFQRKMGILEVWGEALAQFHKA